MTVYPLTTLSEHPFSILTPDAVLDMLEALGLETDGRIMALNSYENRVYQVGLEDADPVIAKFYRPGRWTDAQILEEHAFSHELFDAGLPVVAPDVIAGNTLAHAGDMRIAVFPRRGGRAPELDNLDTLHELGKVLGQWHAIGQLRAFQTRPVLNVESFGQQSMDYLLANAIPDTLRAAYQSLASELLAIIATRFEQVAHLPLIRCHGDCHVGNILWRDDTPHFVDLDDARMAPAIQDLWMLLSGDRYQQVEQFTEVLEGYEMYMDFDLSSLSLIEPLRTLRMMHYAAWLARRWEDPAFPLHFPWFNTDRYWGEHILELREQMALLQEPSLDLGR